jgi:hypothetical protein
MIDLAEKWEKELREHIKAIERLGYVVAVKKK